MQMLRVQCCVQKKTSLRTRMLLAEERLTQKRTAADECWLLEGIQGAP